MYDPNQLELDLHFIVSYCGNSKECGFYSFAFYEDAKITIMSTFLKKHYLVTYLGQGVELKNIEISHPFCQHLLGILVAAEEYIDSHRSVL